MNYYKWFSKLTKNQIIRLFQMFILMVIFLGIIIELSKYGVPELSNKLSFTDIDFSRFYLSWFFVKYLFLIGFIYHGIFCAILLKFLKLNNKFYFFLILYLSVMISRFFFDKGLINSGNIIIIMFFIGLEVFANLNDIFSITNILSRMISVFIGSVVLIMFCSGLLQVLSLLGVPDYIENLLSFYRVFLVIIVDFIWLGERYIAEDDFAYFLTKLNDISFFKAKK